ncbi:MAG: SRPBCC family protein, partial [Bryobacteraceae bacterium]
EIEYKLRWHGLPLGWKTLITEYEPPFSFVDVALRSPYKLWRHRHTFHPTEQGTVVSDRVEYALPFGILGQIAHTVAVRQQLVQIFKFRQKEIVKLLGGKVIELKQPVVV